MQTGTKCRRCNSDRCNVDYRLKWKDVRFPNYSVVSCSRCDIGFVDPLPTPEILDQLYNSVEYHEKDRKAGNFWEWSESKVAAKIHQEAGFKSRYKKHIPGQGHVLDIGSGWGTLLKSFANDGYSATGIELSTTACQFAQERLGLKVLNIGVDDLAQLHSDEEYDLVTMRHVLEHFYDPVAVLKDVCEKISNGGRVVIEVPDYGSYDRKRYGEKWPAFGPYHLWYFNRTSLKKVLSDAGFRPVFFHTFLSELVFPGESVVPRIARKIAVRLGGNRVFSGRSIGVVAQKI